MIERSGERGSGISVLAERHDDDDDIYIYIYIYKERERDSVFYVYALYEIFKWFCVLCLDVYVSICECLVCV